MKLIRNSVFETNSSSCHSVSVCKDNVVMEVIEPNDEGNVIISGGCFGREFRRSNSARVKASYCATAIQEGTVDEDLLRKVIIDQTGADKVFFYISDNYKSPYYSYIDHESVGVPPSTEEEMKNFIFNSNSWLFVAHDEGTPPPGFYDALPFYKEDGSIEQPPYKFEMTIPELNVHFKFLEMPDPEEIEDAIASIDFRYNATKNKYEIKAHYSAGGEKYYEPTNAIKPYPGLITLALNDWDVHDAFQEMFPSEFSYNTAPKSKVEQFFAAHPEWLMYLRYNLKPCN